MQWLAIVFKKVHWLHFVCGVIFLCALNVVETDASDAAFDIFKNRDVVATRTMPDLSALKFGQFAEQKNDYFSKLVMAWEQLNFDRSYISRGNFLDKILFYCIFYGLILCQSECEKKIWMTQCDLSNSSEN